MILLKLALLNITRNKRRSLITVLAVAVGLASLIFLWAFMDGSQEEQRENVIRLATGHLQIHAKGFERKMSPEGVLENTNEILSKIRGLPHVVAVGQRVKCEALIGTSENSRGVLLIGIDPENEPQVTDLKKYIREGDFLSVGENREVLVGVKLAEKIDVKVGDKVVVMTQAMDGTLAGFAYHIKGIIRSSARPIDEFSAFVTLAAGRELLGIEDGTHELMVRLTKRGAIPAFLESAKKFLPEDVYEVSTWEDVYPEVNQWANYSEAIIRTMLIAVMAVIGVGVMNTILMSIFERTRELGVMMAVGTAPSQIVALIFLETLVLEILGILFGILAGYLLVGHFANVGIPLKGFEDAFAESFTSPIVHPEIHFRRVVECVRTLVLITSFISLYPAWRVSHMEPVKAIYHS